MKEELLHYVWRTRRFDFTSLATTRQDPLQILHFGDYNRDSGPDFKNGRIRLRDVVWVGHIEMHLKASDWLQHQHQSDPAYENVILHVVLESDVPIYYPNGKEIPCLVLNPTYDKHLMANYERLQFQKPWVPCEHALPDISDFKKEIWLDRMLTERFIQKANRLETFLNKTNHDWATCFYISMARSFGFLKNGDAMETMATHLPLHILIKHHDQLNQVESLLFGCAGLLNGDMSSTYGNGLQQEYQFLKQKYQLVEMNPVSWQFFRMRPANFPTIRIAQFAALIHKFPDLLSCYLELKTVKDVEKWLSGISATSFWDTHFHFHKESPFAKKELGKQSILSMMINTLAPFLYIYGQYHQREEWVQRSIDMMAEVPPEQNKVIKSWKNAGIKARHAGHTQALIHLKKTFCDQNACLDCNIGHEVLRQTGTT